MDNAKFFESLVKEFLRENEKYDSEMRIFMGYLKKHNLLEKAFDLTIENIEQYFNYAIEMNKIGTPGSLNPHIAVLMSLFDYLTQKHMNNFRELYAYIDSSDFRNRMLDKIDLCRKKSIIEVDLLQRVLNKMDEYIEANKDKCKAKDILKVMISCLYVKMSLIIPIKASEMLQLNVGDINNLREINYHNIRVKIPNGLRRQIVDTIKFIETNYKRKYEPDDCIFEFMLHTIFDRVAASNLSSILSFTYGKINEPIMLKTCKSGTKNTSIYPPESYKTTAIIEMLNKGVNIVYLSQLTGLNIYALCSNYDFKDRPENRDIKSSDINNGLVNTDYYAYL